MIEFFGVEVFMQGRGDVRLDNRWCQTLIGIAMHAGLSPRNC